MAGATFGTAAAAGGRRGRRGTAGGKRSRPIATGASCRCGSIIARLARVAGDGRADAARGPRPRERRHEPRSTAPSGRSCRSCIFRGGEDGRSRRARIAGGRLLLLQDGGGGGRGRFDLRGLAARVSGQHPRHRVHDVARRRPHVQRAAPGVATIAGCSTAVPRTVPRWRSTAASASTSSGRRWSAGRRRRGADARAVLRVLERRPRLHAQAPPARARPAAPREQVAAMPDDSLVAVWEEQAAGTRRVVVGRHAGRPAVHPPGRQRRRARVVSGRRVDGRRRRSWRGPASRMAGRRFRCRA